MSDLVPELSEDWSVPTFTELSQNDCEAQNKNPNSNGAGYLFKAESEDEAFEIGKEAGKSILGALKKD